MKKFPLTCPCDLKFSVSFSQNSIICDNKTCEHNVIKNSFLIKSSKPILISENRTDTVCNSKNYHSYVHRLPSKVNFFRKILFGESVVTKNNCSKFISNLFQLSNKPKLLIIGGAERGSGTDELWSNSEIEIHSIDIYDSETVDIICDSHYLPLKDNSYHGIWIQAVLEHVVEPKKVVNEMYRVLKNKGIVYSETPFMQQVHEGAYDFNRYTVLGHRYLFKKFSLIDMGGVGGADIVFSWSIRYLIWSISRSSKLAKLIGYLTMVFLRPLRIFLSKESYYDSSSGVFFLGKKYKDDEFISHKNLISLYDGQFK